MLQRLKQFNQLCRSFNNARSLPELSEAIINCLQAMDNCRRGGVWLNRPHSEELELMGSFGYDNNTPMPQVHNAYNLLCAPLCYQERILGYIQAEAVDGQKFDDFSQELFTNLANQAGIALEDARLFADVQQVYAEAIGSLANALEARDQYTNGHSVRVTEYSIALGKALNLSSDRLKLLKHASMLHDIGKIGIKDIILNKNGRLTPEERQIIEQHSIFGDLILAPCSFLSQVQKIVLHHHERFDGLGYPDGIAGQDISLEARIIAVVDAFDAMTSDRPYRKALSLEVATNELKNGSGTQFDPEVIKAFVSLIEAGEIRLEEK